MNIFFVTTMTLATLAWADVSHLGKYNYPAPLSAGVANYAPLKSQTQSESIAQIESIKASVPLSSFSVLENIGGKQSYGSQSYSRAQSSGAFNYNAPLQQQQYSAPLQQQYYSAPLQQQQYSAPGLVQNTHFSSAPQQQYSAPAPAQQQSYSNPAATPVIQQSYSVPKSAPVQQSYSALAPAQQQSFSSAGQIQQQSYEVTDNQQQSFGGVETTNTVNNGAYNYQAPVQYQSLPVSAPLLIHQNFAGSVSAPVKQTYSLSSNVQQQSHLSSAGVESGSHNYQPSVPLQQSYTAPASAPIQSISNNYQSAAPIQQQYSLSAQQSYSAPAVPIGVSAAVQQSHSAPVLEPQSVKYSVPAPQKINFFKPATVLSAAPLKPNIGTVYHKTGGYVYHSLKA